MTEDRALISRIIAGDTEAFRHLIRQNERLVAHMIARVVKIQEDREELCQDVFVRVYEKIKEFNFQSKLSTWIATIAYRHALNHLRKKKIKIVNEELDRSFEEKFLSDDNPSEILEEADIEQKVLSYMEELPAHYRTIITLYHVEGMSYSEIGEVTGMPEGTVKNYLFRARQQLKDKIVNKLGKEKEDIL